MEPRTDHKGHRKARQEKAFRDKQLNRGLSMREVSGEINRDLLEECKKLLLTAKEDILNRVKSTKESLNVADEKGGDEGDQTVRALAESEMLGMHDRLRRQLLEVEYALGRIDSGTFGYCEETEEPIESERLKAIPWTRLSIEGAEIRESLKKRFAGR